MSAPPTDSELIEELGRRLPRRLASAVELRWADAVSKLQGAESKAREIEARLRWAEMKVQLLEEKLRLRRIEKYGPGSEKLNAQQLELLELEPGVSAAEVEAEGGRPPLPPPGGGAAAEINPQRPPAGRPSLPAHLERRVGTITCVAGAETCAGCGGATAVIGHDVSERLEVKPAEYFVAVTRREKRACPRCPQRGVAMAPLPLAIIAKGLASDAVVIDVVMRKYVDHLPLYRQSTGLKREAGVDIGRATLDGWVMRVGELLEPVARAMADQIRAGAYIQADETPVGVQTHAGRGKNHQAYLWQYGEPGGQVVFDFRMGRSRAGPARFLRDFAGLLQTDGYAAYAGVGGAGMVHAGCLAHARRKFFEAVKVNPGEALALLAVAGFDAVFAVDAAARRAGLGVAERHQLRQREVPALLAALRDTVERARRAALPASLLGKAAGYALAQWPKLTRFLDHPALELSNNLAENSMRPLALGRKNWIHLGSERAAPRVAAIVSVIESCRRLRLPTRDYLAAILPGLADQPHAALPKLTPAAWAASRRPSQAPPPGMD
ncbi:MAG TPA: IS66 family transposase [Terriglobales bacterium]|nr:IS66 family transposase [Terriglobales bacterium]HVA64633.1 IS66 family transposase [Terriglobales bacterium]